MKRNINVNIHNNKKIKKQRHSVLKLKKSPNIYSIKDLIEIGKSTSSYKNINNIMLCKITPYLEKLDKMIGMKSLKESILYQVMYYLKGFHIKNKNEEYLHTMIMGAPGHGKCLGKDTPIIMYDGTIKMVQNIKNGEKIMGDDSKYRTILSTYHGEEMMYKIKQTYGDDYIVNKSHILSLKLSKSPYFKDKNNFQVFWFTKEKLNSKIFNYSSEENKNIILQKVLEFLKTLPQKDTVIDINILEYIKRPKIWKEAYKGFKVSIDFPKQYVELNPYILGSWLGDSSTAILPTCENKHDNKIKFFDLIKKFNIFKRKSNNNNNFFDLLKRYNVLKNKNIPLIYKTNSETVRLSLLAGLIDSIGFMYNNCYEITQTNKTLAEDILFLTRSLGFQSNMKKCDKSVFGGEKHFYYRIIFRGNFDKIPLIINERKSCKKQIDYLSYKIQIEKLKVDDYYGFMIDGNHRFLLGDFTVTHNTEIAKIIGQLYQSMEILSPNGKFKIAYRDDFVAGYLGQTAIKTRELLNSCIGGVLFVDEVYSLGPGQENRDSFSKECIETITGFLSEHKNDFCFIGAGYEEDIKKCFFAGNKGLERRFQWNHKIDKYDEEDLADILLKMVKEMNWKVGLDRKDIIEILKNSIELFKNAGGDIETFISKCKMVHARRVFSLDPEHMFVLTKKDFENSINLMKKYKLNTKENENIYMSMYI